MYNAFAVVWEWLDYAINAFYNSVVFCGCGGLVMMKIWQYLCNWQQKWYWNDWIYAEFTINNVSLSGCGGFEKKIEFKKMHAFQW